MELPVVVGLHVCERITQDPLTGSVTLFNRFSELYFDEFPMTFSFSVFGVFVNGFGMMAFRVEIEQLATGLIVHEFPTMIEFTDRLEEVVFSLKVPEIFIWFPGGYDVSLTIDGIPTTKCKIHLLESERAT